MAHLLIYLYKGKAMPSFVVDNYEYDLKTHTLTVRFLSGLVYNYINVPEKNYKEMHASVSKGRYLNFKIKGEFEFEKVGDDD
jgi:hypothetical protein